MSVEVGSGSTKKEDSGLHAALGAHMTRSGFDVIREMDARSSPEALIT